MYLNIPKVNPQSRLLYITVANEYECVDVCTVRLCPKAKVQCVHLDVMYADQDFNYNWRANADAAAASTSHDNKCDEVGGENPGGDDYYVAGEKRKHTRDPTLTRTHASTHTRTVPRTAHRAHPRDARDRCKAAAPSTTRTLLFPRLFRPTTV